MLDDIERMYLGAERIQDKPSYVYTYKQIEGEYYIYKELVSFVFDQYDKLLQYIENLPHLNTSDYMFITIN